MIFAVRRGMMTMMAEDRIDHGSLLLHSSADQTEPRTLGATDQKGGKLLS